MLGTCKKETRKRHSKRFNHNCNGFLCHVPTNIKDTSSWLLAFCKKYSKWIVGAPLGWPGIWTCHQGCRLFIKRLIWERNITRSSWMVFNNLSIHANNQANTITEIYLDLYNWKFKKSNKRTMDEAGKWRKSKPFIMKY